MEKIKRFFLNLFFNLDYYEKKLSNYSGYKKGSLIGWAEQSDIPWKTIMKILKELKIYTEVDIRNIYRKMVEDHKQLFYADNTYIVPFGPSGKSGEKLIYDFRHAVPDLASKIIEKYEIVEKSNSNLIFLDDIIGTGTTSINYICYSIQQFITTSNTNFLLALCSTNLGIYEVQKETGFRVLSYNILNENLHYYLEDDCKVFNEKEKEMLKTIIYQLIPKDHRYHLGLLLAFHYGTPDNTMPIIWKTQNENNKLKWNALLPKEF